MNERNHSDGFQHRWTMRWHRTVLYNERVAAFNSDNLVEAVAVRYVRATFAVGDGVREAR